VVAAPPSMAANRRVGGCLRPPPLSEKKTAEQREGRNFVRRERKTRKMSKSGSYNPYIFPRTGSVLLDPIQA